MGFDFRKAPLSAIYKRCGRDCYLDEIRKKLIYITPEEEVRQKVISYLIHDLEVPSEMISVERHLTHYGIDSLKRADIVVHQLNEDMQEVPIAIIECKAPGVYLDDKAVNQVIEYCNLVRCEYAMVINDVDALSYKINSENRKYIQIKSLPKFSEIQKGIHTIWHRGELPPRIPFDNLEDYLNETLSSKDSSVSQDISPQTEMRTAVASFNMFEGLLDTRRKMPRGQYNIFRLIEDYGVRMLSYGNPSGGKFFGPYRSFLIDYKGNTEFVSISITTFWKSTNPNHIKTCLVVAIDNEKQTHHSLQLMLDDNLKISGTKCDFYHHGRIAVGNQGSGKIEDLKEFLANQFPQILVDNKIYLGSLVNDRLWGLDDPQVMDLIENLISYALIRDEFRVYVKQGKIKK